MTGAEPLLFALRAHLYAHPFIAIVIISLALASARKVAATTVEAGFSRPAALTLFVSWLPIALYTFNTFFSNLRFGYGAALSVIVFLVTFLLAMLYVRGLGVSLGGEER